jgi:hypothetical protein
LGIHIFGPCYSKNENCFPIQIINFVKLSYCSIWILRKLQEINSRGNEKYYKIFIFCQLYLYFICCSYQCYNILNNVAIFILIRFLISVFQKNICVQHFRLISGTKNIFLRTKQFYTKNFNVKLFSFEWLNRFLFLQSTGKIVYKIAWNIMIEIIHHLQSPNLRKRLIFVTVHYRTCFFVWKIFDMYIESVININKRCHVLVTTTLISI